MPAEQTIEECRARPRGSSGSKHSGPEGVGTEALSGIESDD